MNSLKERKPVHYGESGVCILPDSRREPGERCFTLHWHDRMELIRVTAGSFELYLGESSAAVLHPGDTAVIAPRQPHMGVAGPQGVVYNVAMFEVDAFFNAAPVTTQFLRPLREGRIQLAPRCTDEAFAQAMDQLVRTADSAPMEAVSAVYRLFSLLMDCCAAVREPRPADVRFASVVEYVAGHFAESLTTGGLSRLFGYEEAYFCRRFKKATGLSVLRYIEVLRLEAAQKLLLETDAAVSAIALQCGFGDVCYFSHRFHKHTGLSPSSFRKGMR